MMEVRRVIVTIVLAASAMKVMADVMRAAQIE